MYIYIYIYIYIYVYIYIYIIYIYRNDYSSVITNNIYTLSYLNTDLSLNNYARELKRALNLMRTFCFVVLQEIAELEGRRVSFMPVGLPNLLCGESHW